MFAGKKHTIRRNVFFLPGKTEQKSKNKDHYFLECARCLETPPATAAYLVYLTTQYNYRLGRLGLYILIVLAVRDHNHYLENAFGLKNRRVIKWYWIVWPNAELLLNVSEKLSYLK